MDPLEGFYTFPKKTKNDFGAITKHKNEPTLASHLKAFFFKKIKFSFYCCFCETDTGKFTETIIGWPFLALLF